MKRIIMKFGGAALHSAENFSEIADLIFQRISSYQEVIVVVSAMGDMTDELLSLAKKIHNDPPKREQDMLISVGERISMALLAMALKKIGIDAISFTGSQAGIITTCDHANARIKEVRPMRLLAPLKEGKVVIVAGFQGVSETNEITTLGRGGSDTTAVALAIALEAVKVEFFKDVPGIFSEDPKIVPSAQFFPHLSYDKALEISSHSGGVLSSRCLALARKNQITLHVLPFDKKESGEKIGTYIQATCSNIAQKQKKIFET